MEGSTMESGKWIREKRLSGGISSFNFTRDAFYKGHWDDQTVRARGLFMRTGTDEVVARSYDKFFNWGERPVELGAPLTAYVKYNGFLGIVSSVDGRLFCASKSTDEGPFADILRDVLHSSISARRLEIMEGDLRDLGCSAVFEVIDPERDPHIVEYPCKKVVLLNMVANDLEYDCVDYDVLCAYADSWGVEVKAKVGEFPDMDSVISHLGYGRGQEGYVVEDPCGNMVKVKSPWYLYWKKMRSVVQRACSAAKKLRDVPETGDPGMEWVLSRFRETGEAPSVIELRNAIENREIGA